MLFPWVSLMVSMLEKDIGKILVTLQVTNRADQIRAEDGTIASDKIRSRTLRDVLN